jgi:hypothetical protein
VSEIINLNDLVGKDIVFAYGTPPKQYRIPGDIPVDSVFELLSMFASLRVMEGDDPLQLMGEMRTRFEEMREKLLGLFRIRDPKLAEWPFGIRGTVIIVQRVLGELGVNASEENPTPPSPPKRPARTVPKSRNGR